MAFDPESAATVAAEDAKTILGRGSRQTQTNVGNPLEMFKPKEMPNRVSGISSYKIPHAMRTGGQTGVGGSMGAM